MSANELTVMVELCPDANRPKAHMYLIQVCLP